MYTYHITIVIFVFVVTCVSVAHIGHLSDHNTACKVQGGVALVTKCTVMKLYNNIIPVSVIIMTLACGHTLT